MISTLCNVVREKTASLLPAHLRFPIDARDVHLDEKAWPAPTAGMAREQIRFRRKIPAALSDHSAIQNALDTSSRISAGSPALLMVQSGCFSSQDSHAFNRACIREPCIYNAQENSGGTLARIGIQFTGYSPFTSGLSMLTLGERSWQQERTSFANLD